MCSAISLALVNSHTGSRIVVLSFHILPPRLGTAEWNGDGLQLARLYFTVLLLGTNIRSTTCDGVLLLIRGHKGIASKAMHAASVMRAITVPYHMLLLDHTFY